MKADVKKLKEQSSTDVKNLRKEHEKKTIADSKKIVSDDELRKNLSDVNVENLIKKSAKGRSIWKNEFKLKYAEDEKKARRKIRSAQFELSKAMLHSIITKQSNDVVKECAVRLNKFYSDGLVEYSIFSNVSENESPEKFKIVHSAYAKMNLFFVK